MGTKKRVNNPQRTTLFMGEDELKCADEMARQLGMENRGRTNVIRLALGIARLQLMFMGEIVATSELFETNFFDSLPTKLKERFLEYETSTLLEFTAALERAKADQREAQSKAA